MNMSKLQILRAFVNQRLTSAVEEIFVLFERTLTEYEDKVSRSKEENERQRKLLDAFLKPDVCIQRADVQQLLMQQEWSSSLDQEDPEPPQIKVEQEELLSCQEGEQFQGLEESDILKFTYDPVTVKSEIDEKEPEISQLHQSQTEESTEPEPLVSRTAEQIEREAGGEDRGGPEPARNLDPPSEDKDSYSSESETENDDDWEQTREPQSGLKSLKNNEAPLSDTECDNDKKSFICSEYDKRFDSHHELKRHKRIHMGGKPFICSVCGKRFSRKRSLPVHMRLHSAEKPFSCSVCGQGFVQKGSLTGHMRIHTGEKPFSCSVCDKSFTHQAGLFVHKRLHSGEKPFSCTVCGKRCTFKASLISHMKLHSTEKPFQCSICKKGFKLQHYLMNHMKIHTGVKPFSCSICGKRFTRRGNLNVHMSRRHLGSNICRENGYTLASSQDPLETPHMGEII